jgi:RNA polymerase sigma-70 factor (ECF subfamily)
MPRHRHPLHVVGAAPPAPAAIAHDDALRSDLVARARNGDTDAWARLYHDHFDAMFKHVCYLTGDALASEDLVQEAFARAIESLPRFAGRSSFSTWLHAIAINVVWKHRDADRKSARTRKLSEQPVRSIPQGDELERRHVQQRRAAALYAILDRLPRHLREAFVLRDLEGLGVAEAAARLGVSEANVRVRAHRARERIHAALVRDGWIDPKAGVP